MRAILASLAICATLIPTSGFSQDMTDDELLKLFLAQRDAVKAAVEGHTSQARGLTLVTADDVQIATEAEKTDTAATGTTTTADTSTTDVAVAATSENTATETQVSENQTAILVNMPAELGINVRVEFAFDSAALDDAQKPKLQSLCNAMKASDINLFRIIGHTDASGTDAYNERLSRLRAEEVQRFFVKDCGIDPGRLEAVGLGKRFLLENVDPKSELNRRVEFQALS